MTGWDGKSKIEHMIARRDDLREMLHEIGLAEKQVEMTKGRWADRVMRRRTITHYGFAKTKVSHFRDPEFVRVPHALHEAFVAFLATRRESVEAELQELLGTLELIEQGLS